MKDGPIRTAPPTVAHYGTMPDEEAIRPHTIRNILARDYALSFLVFFGFLAVFHSLTDVPFEINGCRSVTV